MDSTPLNYDADVSASSTDIICDHASSSSSSFGAKSLIESTEMALNATVLSSTESLMESPNVISVEDVECELQHDEIGLNPIEDVPALEKFIEEQNTHCCDVAIEKCFSCSMIPEKYVEMLLCRADKMFCTCQVTDWMDDASGSNFCGNKDKFLTDDNETLSSAGSVYSFSNSLLVERAGENSLDSEYHMIHSTHLQKENTDIIATNKEEKSYDKPKKKTKILFPWKKNIEKGKDEKGNITENVSGNVKEKNLPINNNNVKKKKGMKEERVEILLDIEEKAKDENNDSKCDIVLTGIPSTVNSLNISTSANEVIDSESKRRIETDFNDDDDYNQEQEKAKNKDEDGDRKCDVVPTQIPFKTDPTKLLKSTIEYMTNMVEVDGKKIGNGLDNEEELKNDEEDSDSRPFFMMDPHNIFTSTDDTISNNEKFGKKIGIEIFLNGDKEDERNIDKDEVDISGAVLTILPSSMHPFKDFKSTTGTDKIKGDKKSIDIVSNNDDQKMANITDIKSIVPQLSPMTPNEDSMIKKMYISAPKKEKKEEAEKNESGFECVLQRKIKDEEVKTEESQPVVPLSPETMEVELTSHPIVTPSSETLKKKKSSFQSRKTQFGKLSKKLSIRRSSTMFEI